jgi:hypothetical protein
VAKKKPPTKARRGTATAAEPDARGEVDAHLDAARHPLRRDIDEVRRIVLGVSPAISEGVKWNAPSFRTKEWFATVFLRDRKRVRLVFHRGAKVKDDASARPRIDDPKGLIEWLANERCLVTVGAGREIAARRTAFAKIVRQWIAQR